MFFVHLRNKRHKIAVSSNIADFLLNLAELSHC